MKLAFGFAVLVAATPALACVPPPPPLQLSGESRQAYADRSKAFVEALSNEDQRARQVRLYGAASRVSLARVINSTPLPGTLDDGQPRRRVDVQPVAAFKGPAPSGRAIRLEDAGMTTCGRYGGGSATAAKPGDYVLLFEGVDTGGLSRNLGLLLNELREPRILERFNEVIQQARSATDRQ